MTEHLTLAEQESVRVRLRQFAREHGIGVPRLARRVREQTGLEIPVKTCQRFLAGDRVNDLALSALARFVDKVEDPIRSLGETLFRLQGSESHMDLAGSYTLVHDHTETAVTIIREGHYWRMVERDRASHRIYEGVIVNIGGVHVASLRDRNFGQPRHYHLYANRQSGDPAFFCDCDRAGQAELRRV